MTETTKLHRVDRGAADVIETGTWWDHGDIDEGGGHTTGRGRVYGVLPVRYEDCIRYGCRSVAVIDFEDREQVERLVTAYAKQRRLINGEDVTRTDDMQAALREFVNPTPPKPEEPTGLGAVVACENGVKVIRTDDPEFPWVDAARPGENSYHWTQCGGLPESPVKVLSEGIPA